jgi:hypothetical protein
MKIAWQRILYMPCLLNDTRTDSYGNIIAWHFLLRALDGANEVDSENNEKYSTLDGLFPILFYILFFIFTVIYLSAIFFTKAFCSTQEADY